ncbi:MAG: hypothetical protein K2G96_00670 [Clostridia bacterium]|nr:hypothetical protein [Clostridia bacterium]
MKNISKSGSSLVRKMQIYLSANGVNYCEVKNIRADIISMIAEAEARGESAESIFPDGGKNFCDDVLKNAVKKRWYEYVLSVMSYMAICFAVVFPIIVIFTRLCPNYGEAVSGVTMDIRATGLLVPFLTASIAGGASLFANRSIFNKKRIVVLLVCIVLVPIIALIIVFAVYGAFGRGTQIISLNWVGLWLTVVAVAVIESVLLYFLSKRNAKHKN